MQQRPADRYEKYFKQEMKPWQRGKKILVLPPTNAISNFFNVTDWLDNTLEIPQAIDLSLATPRIKPHLFSIVIGISLSVC